MDNFNVKAYRVGRFPDGPFKGGCLFFSDSLDYYAHSDTGYRREDAKGYLLNLSDFKVFDPMGEWGLEAESWSVVRTSEEFAKEKGLQIADYLPDVNYDDPKAYHEVLLDTDSLAAYGRDSGYDVTVLRDVPTRDGESHTEYAVHNSECVKPLAMNEGLDVAIKASTAEYDPDDLDMRYVDALIDSYFDAEEKSGAPRVEGRKENCYRPWGHRIDRWLARKRVDGMTQLLGDSPTAGLITILELPSEDFDKVVEAVRGKAFGEDLDIALGRGREPLMKYDVSSDKGLELIDRFADKRYWYIAWSDGGFETVDGFDIGGKYAKLNTYEEALKLWEEYPLEEEMLRNIDDYPDDYHESHVLLYCITDAEFERDGNEYDDLAAAENDFRWSESSAVADRCMIYDPEDGGLRTEVW